ncbi:hypothetical protein BC829DRAFT_400875 [Chytridium lagenaria]|nr:hypothetical protein BC829DRAFT_400875 [Chytridium lagenaria]
MPIGYICRKESFSAAHRLHSNKMTDEENLEVFEVIVRGEIDPITGMVMNLTDLKHCIKTSVIDIMDHKNLSLEKTLPAGRLHEIILHETKNNSVIYRGE